MDFFSLAVLLWLIITAMLVVGVVGAGWFVCHWAATEATKLYASHCDVAIQHPHFSNPAEYLNLRSQTLDGKKDGFEQYEWYVARLVYVLDRCLALGPRARWLAVAHTQLGAHKQYFGSDYYAQQEYLPHYSKRMQKLILAQRGAA